MGSRDLAESALRFGLPVVLSVQGLGIQGLVFIRVYTSLGLQWFRGFGFRGFGV